MKQIFPDRGKLRYSANVEREEEIMECVGEGGGGRKERKKEGG